MSIHNLSMSGKVNGHTGAAQQAKLPFCKVNLPIVNRTKVLFTMDGFAGIFFAYRCEAANARWNTANRWLSISKREFL